MQKSRTTGAAHAVARVFGEHLDFAAVTRAIGHSASEIRRAGDPRPTGKPVPRDVWMLEAPLPRSEALGQHLLWLRNVLAPAYEFLHASAQKGEVSIYCGVTVDASSYVLMLSAEALKLFVELDTPFDLSLVFTAYNEF